MALRPSLIRGAVIVGLLASACQVTGPPRLVLDGAGIFSADARARAESRLRAIAAEHGLWAFVITDVQGDPPRMLDPSMREADSRQVRAVAILFGSDSMVGAGFSRVSVDRGDAQTLSPPRVDDLIAEGDADAALEAVVDYLESWAGSPQPAGEPPPFGGEEAPSGAP